MTAIQRATLPHALAGRDVLGAAKTGSGKTLAFIVPVPLSPPSLIYAKLLEKLWMEKWTKFDGLGAVVISPTRELVFPIESVSS